MTWYQQYEELTNKDQETFQEAVNLLFSQTFLVSERVEDRPYYRFVERHQDIFTSYFSLAGWELALNKRLAVIRIYNRLEKNRHTFTLQQTIVLFILRLLYDEKQRDLRLTNQVTVSGREIHEKYLALQIKNRLPSQEDMYKNLRLFQRFSLLDLKKGHWKETEVLYVLYPSLLLVLEAANLEKLAVWVAEKTAWEEESDADADQD